MGWNYRIMRAEEVMPGTGAETYYRIVEVFYNEKGEANSWSETGAPIGETVDEVVGDMAYMTFALLRPVMNERLEEVEPGRTVAEAQQIVRLKFQTPPQKAEGRDDDRRGAADVT